MNLARKFSEWHALADSTSGWCVGFDILNLVCTRLRLKWKSAVAVRFGLFRDRPFYVRPGTTDWSTFRITFVSDEYRFVLENLRLAQSIVDLGANIGDSSRYFADAYPDARLVAIEPDPGNFEICRKNVADITPEGRVTCKQCFVGGHAGFAGVDRSQGEWAFAMDRNSTSGEKIPIITMEDLLREFRFAEVDLLKVDIEGAEEELFRNCSGWISRIRHLAVETCAPYSVTQLEKDLTAAGAHFIKVHHAVPDGYHELAMFRRADVPVA